MALPDQMAAYTDCYDLYEKAVADGKGARAAFESKEKANYFRMRMNHARVLLRRQSKDLYDRTDPRWNKSEFDVFMNTIKEGHEEWWVYVEKHNANILAVEGLSEDEA